MSRSFENKIFCNFGTSAQVEFCRKLMIFLAGVTSRFFCNFRLGENRKNLLLIRDASRSGFSTVHLNCSSPGKDGKETRIKFFREKYWVIPVDYTSLLSGTDNITLLRTCLHSRLLTYFGQKLFSCALKLKSNSWLRRCLLRNILFAISYRSKCFSLSEACKSVTPQR